MSMNYPFIWYPMTSYYNVSNKNLQFKVASKISPYLEVNDDSLNKLDNKLEIELNPFIRFQEETQELLIPEVYENDKNLIDKFLNINFHLLGEIDLYTGQNKKDIYVKEILNSIKAGDLGNDLKKNIEIFKGYEKHIIADILYETYAHLNMIDAFKKAIKLIYSDSIFYDNISSEKNMILYLNYSKSENEKKVDTIRRIFFPVGLDIDIFWKKHFGVIGYPVTMEIGEILIY